MRQKVLQVARRPAAVQGMTSSTAAAGEGSVKAEVAPDVAPAAVDGEDAVMADASVATPAAAAAAAADSVVVAEQEGGEGASGAPPLVKLVCQLEELDDSETEERQRDRMDRSSQVSRRRGGAVGVKEEELGPVGTDVGRVGLWDSAMTMIRVYD